MSVRERQCDATSAHEPHDWMWFDSSYFYCPGRPPMTDREEGQEVWHAGTTLHLSNRNHDPGKREPLCGSRENPRSFTGNIDKVECEACLKAAARNARRLEEALRELVFECPDCKRGIERREGSGWEDLNQPWFHIFKNPITGHEKTWLCASTPANERALTLLSSPAVATEDEK
jgi:hypothetical protein